MLNLLASFFAYLFFELIVVDENSVSERVSLDMTTLSLKYVHLIKTYTVVSFKLQIDESKIKFTCSQVISYYFALELDGVALVHS